MDVQLQGTQDGVRHIKDAFATITVAASATAMTTAAATTSLVSNRKTIKKPMKSSEGKTVFGPQYT